MEKLKGVSIGAGYFSQFHYEAWKRIPQVNLTAICDNDLHKAEQTARTFGIGKTYTDYQEMFEKEQPDFVDIITPAATHLEICQKAADAGIHIICQKPLAPSFTEAAVLVKHVTQAKIRFMVHENFRFQPWHREIKKMLDDKVIGDKLHTLNFRMRMGDGWPKDAYLHRQPYFRTMPRLLIYETGVHFIDTFRFLAGEIEWVFAQLRKLNPEIAGEDAGMVFFGFGNGSQGLFDANRYNESNHRNPRYTFGEFLVEGNGGTLRLYADGTLTVQPLGKAEKKHLYHHEDRGFGADCVYFTQLHFVENLLSGAPFETNGQDYLKNLTVQEAIYQSAAKRHPTVIDDTSLI